MRGTGLYVLCLFFGACVEVPSVPIVGDLPVDGGSVADGGSTTADAGPAPIDAAPPEVRITTPTDGATLGADVSTVLVEGTASDDVSIATVRLAVGANAPVQAATTDFYRTWRVMISMPAGPQRLRAIVTDSAGKTAEAAITITRAPARTDAAPPSLAILEPAAGARSTRVETLVTGTADDDTGVAKVELRVDGTSAFVPVETGDNFAHWLARVGIAPARSNVIRVRATDIAGNTTERTVTVVSVTAVDRDPPMLTVAEPVMGATIGTATVLVRGAASDNISVSKVEVAVGDGAFARADSTDAFATWQRTVSLRPGANRLRVRATDVSDLETVVELSVTSTFQPEWSDPTALELRLAAPRDRNVSLVLDKVGLGEVIPQSVREAITILNLNPTTLMTSTMEAIKNTCGTNWRNAGAPTCSAAGWGQAEKNLWTLLTMTPANVNVVGTSIEGTKDIAETLSSLGVIDDFSTILADTLGLAKTDEIVDTSTAVSALKDDLIKTHPNSNADGTLPVTIQDGFTDMATLSTKFGPSGQHPGFLDPGAPTFSRVLLDTFQMSVRGTSNLTWYDGVNLSSGKDYIAILPSPTTDVIAFDFANTMTVSGLAANPTVNLTFITKEDARFLRSAVLENDQDAPPHPGNGQAWTAPKWLIEYVLVDASYRKYRTRAAYENLYEVPILGTDEALIVVGRNSNVSNLFGTRRIAEIANPRAGWARFWTLFNLGSPPKAQYLWDMIAEISQIRLRDGNVPEGQGNTRFTLTGLPVGLTGAQIIAQMRPAMEAQKSILAQRLLGDYRTNNGAVDFYLKGVAGDLYLFFVHASDPLPRAATYTQPGFYSDAALTQKVSSTAAQTSGDAVHEKVKLGVARTLYAKDKNGVVYRLDLDAAQSDRVALRIARKL